VPDPLTSLDSASPRVRRGDRLLALAVFALALVAYARAAAPGIVAEGDSSEYVAAAHVVGIPHAPGYPTYMLLASLVGALVPAEGLARALNLTSALCGAVACGLVALLALRLARRAFPAAGTLVVRGAGAVAGLALASATEFWNQALSAEVYTLAACLLAACLLLLHASDAPRRRLAAALVAGLAFGVHYHTGMPCALLVLASAWGARRELGRRGFMGLAGGFALGLTTFLYLPLRSLADPALDFGDPETPAALARMLTLADMPTGKALAREFGVLWQQIGAVAGLAAGQWPAWVFALAALGVLAFGTRTAPLGAGAALAAVLALDYAGILAMSNFALVPGEIYELRFLFLPAYLVLAVLAGLGCAGLAAVLERGSRLVVPALLAVLAVAFAPWLFAQQRLLDKRANHVMREYGLGLLAAAEGPALLFTFGDNAWMPLVYLQTVEGARADVTVIAAGLLRHAWYRDQLRARSPELVLPEDAPGVAGIARANLGRVGLYHADPRAQGLAGFQEVPSGLLMRLVPTGERVAPVVPPAPATSAPWAPLDRREASIRADVANAYLRTAQWCRQNGHPGAAEAAAEQGLELVVPEPRLGDFHLVRAALWLELGDLRFAGGRSSEALTAWRAALAEGVSSTHTELAEKRLVAHVPSDGGGR
jgi:hypothetical protein